MAAITLGAGFMAAMTLIVALARHVIPLLFLGFETPAADATPAWTRRQWPVAARGVGHHVPA